MAITKTGQEMVGQANFDDFEAYEHAVLGWNWIVRKLDTGGFSAGLLQVSIGPVSMTFSQFDSTVAVSGVAQLGLASFGIPMPDSSPAMWCGEETSERTISLYGASAVFEAVIRPGFETVILSIEPEYLEKLADSFGYERPKGISSGSEVMRCHPGYLRELHRLLHGIRSRLKLDYSLLQCPSFRETLEFELPQLLLHTLSENAPAPAVIAPHLRQRALRRALDYIAAHPRDPIGLQDLSRNSGASVRTLRRAFSEKLGIAPKTYIQARRLNRVYRELRYGDDGEISVSDAAHHWGFWHMSQFAIDYRRWFGELPSATLRRSA